jgi:outer membrane protein TolC
VNLSFTIERGGKRELRTRLAEEQVLDALRGQVFALRTAFIQALQARVNLQVALANRSSLYRTELSQDQPSSTRPLRANDTLGVGISIPIFTSRITEGNVAVAAQRSQAMAQAQGTLAAAQADLATAWDSLSRPAPCWT